MAKFMNENQKAKAYDCKNKREHAYQHCIYQTCFNLNYPQKLVVNYALRRFISRAKKYIIKIIETKSAEVETGIEYTLSR